MEISGIYQIQSIIKPGSFYIGSSVGIKKRWRNHKYDLKNNKHASSKLQNHYNKYGEQDLIFVILELCFPEFLTAREQYYIDKLKPFFNNCKIANSQLGIKRSNETKEKIRLAQIGKPIRYGWHHTEETKQKMRDAHINRVHHKHTNEWKKVASERMKKENNPNYGKPSPMRGKHYSLEVRLRMSLAKKGKPSKTKGIKKPPVSDELRLKRSINSKGEKNPFYGKKHTEESKLKIKEAWMRRKFKVVA